MGDRALHQLLRHIRRMAGPPPGVLSDAELLGRFVDHRDEAAFEALVWRHGQLVLGVCQRVLRHEQDSEDAFQAAFLALARKAASIRRRGAIGPWLYRVALRVALRAREQAAACKSLAPLPEALPALTRPREAEQRELRHILEEEIQRLPLKYRAVVVLRYLEGRSTTESAAALGCPAGTILSRLAWARRRLQARLATRGAAFPAAIAAAAATGDAMGAPPFGWVAAAVRGAVAFAASTRSGVGPTRSALLAEGVLRAMMMTKVKVATFLILGVLASGTILQGPFLRASKPAPQAEQASAAPAVPDDPPAKAEPPDVTVTHPVKREIVDFEDFTGRTEASLSIEIRPRITATLTRVVVQAGAEVKRGDILFELDSRALDVKAMKAAARVRRAESARVQVKRKLENTKQSVNAGIVGPPALDSVALEVSEAEAALSLAQVEWDQAKLDLNATKIIAPAAGRVGRILLSEGSLVSPTTPLTTLISGNPIKVEFQMDERTFASLRKHLPGTSSGPKLTVLLGITGDEGFPRRGSLESVDNRFDLATGTIRGCAVFPNSHEEMLPGMFARVRVPLSDPHEALMIPEGAIASDNGLKFVRVVGGNNVLKRRDVTLGQLDKGLRVIQKGLSAADRVVIGLGKSTPQFGVIVNPREAPVPKLDSKAKPGAGASNSK